MKLSLVIVSLMAVSALAQCDLVSVSYVATSATEVDVGQSVSYNVVVTNVAGCALSNVQLQDASGCTSVPASVDLAVGQTRTFPCSVVVTETAQIGGQVTATVTETETSSFSVGIRSNPAIDIRKNAKGNTDTQTVRCGGDSTVTWIIVVTNTGDIGLNDVRVSDPASPSCDRTFGFLAPGERQLYLCRLVNVNEDFTNRACASGFPTDGAAAVQDCDENIVDVVCPVLSISKTPDTQVITAGSDAVFSITVGNSGDVALTDVQVTDARTPSCSRTFAAILPGQSQTFQCVASNVASSFTNTACASAGAVAGPRIDSVCDSALVTIAVPAVDIRKNAEGQDSQTVRAGGDVSWLVVVTNTGEANLQNVRVSDPNAPDCARTFGSLAAGSTQTYTCFSLNVQNSFNTAATVSATAGSVTVTDSDPSDVIVIRPSVALTKSPDSQTVTAAGGTASFTIVVTNTGDVELTNVQVTDAQELSCERTFVSLPVGASQTIACQTTNIQAAFVNRACVSADAPVGSTVGPVCDDANVELAFAALYLSKHLEGPDSRTVRRDTDVSFDIEVRNSGTLVLSDVVVIDPRTASCERNIGTLMPGQTVVYTCVATAVLESFQNFMRVNANSDTGAITITDTSDIVVITPAIKITSNRDGNEPLFVNPGEPANFIITVLNSGDVALANVVVTNPQVPSCGRNIPSLAASEKVTYACTFDNVQLSFVSSIQACAQVPIDGGDDVCSLDQTRVVRIDEVCVGGVNPSVLVFDFTLSTGGITGVYAEVFHSGSPTSPIVLQSLERGQTFTVSLGGAELSPSIIIRTYASVSKQVSLGEVIVPIDCAGATPMPVVGQEYLTEGSGFTATYTLLGESKK